MARTRRRAKEALDPARLSIIDSLVSAVAEEMGASLRHTALSPNIKERRDYSCAVFDVEGNLLAQAAHIPVHLGAIPESVRAVAELAPFRPGDLAILNDPFLGGTHLPDVTMVSPVFGSSRRRPLIGFVASRAHQADIGGMAPGSMPVARELIQEGLIIPPVRLYRAGELVPETLALILRNVRTPDERRGDLAAQVAAHRIGEQRLAALAERIGTQAFKRASHALLNYGERLACEALRDLPPGEYAFHDHLDSDGVSEGAVPIMLRLTIDPSGWHLDFSGSAKQRAASINAVAAVTRSAAYYVLRCLLPSETPTNSGLFRHLRFTLPEGSVVNAQPPVAVAAGNVETSQRIVDVIWGALAQALPTRVPAASSGTMNNLAAGGIDPSTGRSWAYYETIGGGHGGGPGGPGIAATQSHMTNTLNTPVEELELSYPMRVLSNRVRRASGGHGMQRGGDGLIRCTEFLAPTTVTIISERRAAAPWGLAGGAPGKPGQNWHTHAGRRRLLPGKCVVSVEEGDVICIATPGGGGWGALTPRTRGAASTLEDTEEHQDARSTGT